MATSAGWVRLAQEVQFVDQCLNHPANLKSDFSSDCYFLRGMLFDLAILSITLDLSILVRTTCKLCLLCTGAEPQITLTMNSATLDFNSQWGLLVDSQSPAPRQADLLWNFGIHSQVVELFRQCDRAVLPKPASAPATEEKVAYCSPWLKSLLMSDTVPWQDPLPDDEHLLCEGGGTRAHAGTSHLADDPDDELPLSLLARGSDDPPPDAAEPERPLHISYFAKVPGGRAEYTQPLWPECCWSEVQCELNRAVRRKMSTWWLYFRGVPLDPEAPVPRASSPYDHVQGELRRLTQPLNFQELRANGMLCVPSGPTHTGMFNTPIDAHVVYTTAAPVGVAHGSPRPRLVAADYDTSSDVTLYAISARSGSGSSRCPSLSSAEHSVDDAESLAPTECYISEELPGEPVLDAPPPQDDLAADSEDDPEGKLFNVWVQRVNIDGQPAYAQSCQSQAHSGAG
eukprot:6289804-Amphidinium_carterae.6